MFKTLLLRTLLAGAALSVATLPAAPSFAADDGEETKSKKKSKRGKKASTKRDVKKKKPKKASKEAARAAAIASAKEDARRSVAQLNAEREKEEAEAAAAEAAAKAAAEAEAQLHAEHLGVIERLEQIASATQDIELRNAAKRLRAKETERHQLVTNGGAQ